MRSHLKFTLAFLLAFGGPAYGQTTEGVAQARAFFATYDLDGDGLLSKPEFVDGFIAQSRKESPNRTAAALLLYGRPRIERCLGLGFDRADADANGLMSLEELRIAYRDQAFDSLRKIC